MAIPQFLQREYGYYQMTGVTNVNTITPQIYNLCANLNNNWTKPDGNNALILRSKPNSAGKYLELSFTENNATTISPFSTNSMRQTCGGGPVLINANGSTINIFYGDGYCYLECVETGDWSGAWVMDVEPCSEQFGVPVSVCSNFRKNAALLNITGAGIRMFSGRYPPETGASYASNSGAAWLYGCNTFKDVMGSYVYAPVLIDPSGMTGAGWQNTTYSWSGRIPQMMTGYKQTVGTTHNIPLGDGNTGSFQALYMTQISNRCNFMRIA